MGPLKPRPNPRAAEGKRPPPPALLPVYHSQEANENIYLYQGPLALTRRNLAVSGPGAILLQWLPAPKVGFHIEGRISSGQATPDFSKSRIEVESIGLTGEALETRSNFNLIRAGAGNTYEAQGTFVGPLHVRHSKAGVSRILFHLPNFFNYVGSPVAAGSSAGWRSSRLILEMDRWRITLDGIEGLKALVDSLKEWGGYALTHVGIMERRDFRRLSWREAEETLNLLFYSFSFARGAWCGPNLVIGLDRLGSRVREDWRIRKTGAWERRPTWFPTHNPQALSTITSGLFTLWQDEEWRNALELALSLFVEAHGHQSSEVSVVLAQAALELLAWVILVEKQQRFSRGSFKNLSATEQLTHLLDWIGVSPKLPSAAPNLRKFAWTQGWRSGPSALVGLRRGIVHPERRAKSYRSTGLQRYEARLLSLWYVELTFLRLVNYDGPYANRLRSTGWEGQTETVPWV
jgi:hypothetical protein